MNTLQTNVLISGGGIAGLTTACAFGAAGFNVICVDPAPPITLENADGSDLRTTAFLQPAQKLLEDCGLWARLGKHAAPMQIMRIVDAGGENFAARDIADFNAADISDNPFGWNLPNWLLRREMLAQIEGMINVTFIPGVSTSLVTTRDTEARVLLSDGQTIIAQLLIAADGRGSQIRKNAGIGVKTWRYGQKALAFSVTHPIPHENVSTEIHRTGGPFTLVPMPDLDGSPRSAVVWMEKGARIQELGALNESDFTARINDRSCGLFGPLKLIGRRTVWPIISQLANRLNADRTALIAEAAHVVPPIGAQGLNMSLGDLACLLDLAKADTSNIGSQKMLAQYHRSRWPVLKARVTGIDLLNRASMAENPALKELRRLGLKTLHNVGPIRKSLMRVGLGSR